MAETHLGWYMPTKRRVTRQVNGGLVSSCKIGMNKEFKLFKEVYLSFEWHF